MRIQDTTFLATPLLWTGGWDSTYRLLMLLLVEQRPVQPYYIIDKVRLRRSVPAEREAMRQIRRLIAVRYPAAFAGLRETIECPLAHIAPDAVLAQHFEACLQRGFIGGQYEWLARFCKQHEVDQLELAIHRDDKARNLLAELIDASRVALDPRFIGDSRYELFRFFRFPVFDLTKQEMRARAQEYGFEEVMALTWFCHRPRNCQPCGTCNPCIYTIEEGLGDRIPALGRLRYNIRVAPRLRHWLTRSPHLYLGARALYRRARALAARPTATSPN